MKPLACVQKAQQQLATARGGLCPPQGVINLDDDQEEYQIDYGIDATDVNYEAFQNEQLRGMCSTGEQWQNQLKAPHTPDHLDDAWTNQILIPLKTRFNYNKKMNSTQLT